MGDGQAGERALGGALSVQGISPFAGNVETGRDDGVECRVDRFDAIDVRVEDLPAAQLATLDQPTQFRGREQAGFAQEPSQPL